MINQELWTKFNFWIEKTLDDRVDKVFVHGELSKFLRAKLVEEVTRREQLVKELNSSVANQ